MVSADFDPLTVAGQRWVCTIFPGHSLKCDQPYQRRIRFGVLAYGRAIRFVKDISEGKNHIRATHAPMRNALGGMLWDRARFSLGFLGNVFRVTLREIVLPGEDAVQGGQHHQGEQRARH